MTSTNARRIDVHHHFWPRGYMAEEQQRNAAYSHSSANAGRLLGWSAEQAIEAMDIHGIAIGLGSISTPGVWYGDDALARRLSREWNEEGAKTVQAHPRRFGFLAVIAPPDVDGALKEIEYALDTLKADGIGLLSNYAGLSLGDPSFAPVFAELNRRKAVVFTHPTAHPATATLIPGLVAQGIEFPFDSTRTITSLCLSGRLTQCPDIKFIFSHGGGALPYLAARIEHVARGNAAFKAANPDGIVNTLKRLYLDTSSATSAPQMAALMKFLPPGQLLYGSDYPFVNPAPDIAELNEYPLSTHDRAGIERDNAVKLFPRLASL